jgi:hypothetical protein
MSVPPSGRRPSSTPPSKGKPDEGHENHKDFKLPGKKDPVAGQDEKVKKKNLFDLAGEDNVLAGKQQGVQQEIKAEGMAADSISAVEAKQQINQISQLVQKMVETMRIGEVNGQQVASMDLKKGPDVPLAFSGSNLTISYQTNGIAIHFDNFMTPQQQNTAINMVEKNKEQLQQMVLALNAKNIQVAELTIGSHTVALPRVEPLPPPYQVLPGAQAETRQQQEGGRQGREDQEPEER